MPLALVQGSSVGAWGTTNSGSTPNTDLSVTWAGSRTVGNLLLLIVNSDSTESTPTGWTLDKSQVNNSAIYLWSRIADNSSTDTPTFTSNFQKCLAWAEYKGNKASPSDVFASVGNTTDTTTRSTGTTATTAQANELAVAAWGWSKGVAQGDTSGFTWSGQTNSFVEVGVDVGTALVGTTDVGLCVATRDLTTVGTYESTATCSGTVRAVALIGTYKGTNSIPPQRPPRSQRWYRKMPGIIVPAAYEVIRGSMNNRRAA